MGSYERVVYEIFQDVVMAGWRRETEKWQAVNPGWQHLLSNRIGEARAWFREQSGPEALVGLGWTYLPSGDWWALWNCWAEIIRRHPQHWSAVAVIPFLASGGGVPGQHELRALLRQQMAVASPELASLARDVLGLGQRLGWKACGPYRYGVETRRRKWRALRPGPDFAVCDLYQLGTVPDDSVYYAATVVRSTKRLATFWECDPGCEVRAWLNDEPLFHCQRRRAGRSAGFPFRGRCVLQSGDNVLVTQVSRRNFADAGFRFQLEQGLAGKPTEAIAGFGDPPNVAPWFLELLPADECLFRADYLHRLGYDSEALEVLGDGIENSALLTYLANEIRGVANDVGIPELRTEANDAEAYIRSGRLWPREGDGCVASIPDSPISWRQAYASMVQEVRSQLAELAALYPDEPYILQRRLNIMTPHVAPVDVDQLAEEDLEEAGRLMERLARVHPNGWGWDYHRMGDLYRRRGRMAEAVRNYRKAARYAPTKAEPWIDLARCLDDPEPAYRQALKREPDLIHLRDQVQQRLPTMAPEQSCVPGWPTRPIETVLMTDVGFYDVCDGTEREEALCLEELRQLVYPDGAVYGYYRKVVQLPETIVFSVTFPRLATQARLHRSLLYRLDGRVEDTRDMAQGSWTCFHRCRRDEMAESCWLLETPGAPGFFQKWEVGPKGRYVLVHPADLTLRSSRPPDKSQVGDGWKVDVWTTQGDLRVSAFENWKAVSRACRRYFTCRPGPNVTARARELGNQESVLQFLEQVPEKHFHRADWSFDPPDIVLAKESATRLERCLLLKSLLTALEIPSNLCFGLLHEDVPGPWFRQPAVKLGSRFWPAEPAQPRIEL